MKDPLGVSPSKGNPEKVGDDLGGESRLRESKGTYECCAG